jgi:hypothetical protein
MTGNQAFHGSRTRRFRGYGFDEQWNEVAKTGSYYRFPLEGDLHYSRGGLVFGWLPIPSALRGA